MSRKPFPRRLRDIEQAAKDAGWTPDYTSKGHPRLSPPAGTRHVLDAQGIPVHGVIALDGTGPMVAPITFALTPSDHRGDRNSLAALRRAGVAL